MSKGLRGLVKNRNFIIFGSLFFIFLAVIETRQFLEERGIEKEKQGLQQQADELSKKNSDLQSSIAYLQTNDYKEKTAREQLNLRKDGEFVYSFSNQNVDGTGAAQGSTAASDEISNPHKWWNYFFNP